ncbi:hypothetical protein [Nocardioides nanhaiensis]|uniref:DUF3039 domain-containing protein n=1 Tax=Nocardioides nanhaiensis TaxID=1476871 RepID=A0ABP8W9D6_9ACTN
MSEETIVKASADQVLRAAERMVDLPWPEPGSDASLTWELEGLEGETLWLTHVLPLASGATPAEITALTAPLLDLADRRWGTRHRFDATRFTDDASTPPGDYDRRSAPAGLVRSLGATSAVWWRRGAYAALLVDSSRTAPADTKLALLVLERDWLGPPGAEERALESPLVQDLLSGEPSRVLSATWTVIGTRDPELLAPLVTALPAIRSATAGLDLGGALIQNATHVRHALTRLQLVADGECLCTAYPDHLLHDVAREQQRGHVRVEGTVPNERQWEPDRICVCTACGRRYQVEQGEYHYPWWQWRPLAGRSGAPAAQTPPT